MWVLGSQWSWWKTQPTFNRNKDFPTKLHYVIFRKKEHPYLPETFWKLVYPMTGSFCKVPNVQLDHSYFLPLGCCCLQCSYMHLRWLENFHDPRELSSSHTIQLLFNNQAPIFQNFTLEMKLTNDFVVKDPLQDQQDDSASLTTWVKSPRPTWRKGRIHRLSWPPHEYDVMHVSHTQANTNK